MAHTAKRSSNNGSKTRFIKDQPDNLCSMDVMVSCSISICSFEMRAMSSTDRADVTCRSTEARCCEMVAVCIISVRFNRSINFASR